MSIMKKILKRPSSNMEPMIPPGVNPDIFRYELQIREDKRKIKIYSFWIFLVGMLHTALGIGIENLATNPPLWIDLYTRIAFFSTLIGVGWISYHYIPKVRKDAEKKRKLNNLLLANEICLSSENSKTLIFTRKDGSTFRGVYLGSNMVQSFDYRNGEGTCEERYSDLSDLMFVEKE